jgi:putative flippase GtrA
MEKMKIDYKFIKFLFVGGLNTIFGYLIYSFFLFIGLNYVLATLLATIAGVLFNFKTTGVLVFKINDNKLLWKFFGVYAVVYALNIFFLSIFNHLNINLYIAGFILLLPMALVSFYLMKRFVFGEKNVS